MVRKSTTGTRIDWTREEVELIVADYLDMFTESLSGMPVNKSEHRRRLLRLLPRRTEGSIEFKHQNISQVLVELGLDYLDGYRPATNVQELVREVVPAQLTSRSSLLELIRRVAEAPLERAKGDRTSLRLVAAPTADADRSYTRTVRERIVPVTGVDYQARDARNAALGAAGELAVIEFEQQRLWREGKRRLANRVERVSVSRGDGLGYDILSFEPSGRERCIEVKTTQFAALVPFFLTEREVRVSSQIPDRYHLYRLFRFSRNPQLFILQGALADTCRLTPTEYRGQVA